MKHHSSQISFRRWHGSSNLLSKTSTASFIRSHVILKLYFIVIGSSFWFSAVILRAGRYGKKMKSLFIPFFFRTCDDRRYLFLCYYYFFYLTITWFKQHWLKPVLFQVQHVKFNIEVHEIWRQILYKNWTKHMQNMKNIDAEFFKSTQKVKTIVIALIDDY